jgi:hypothetical protein
MGRGVHHQEVTFHEVLASGTTHLDHSDLGARRNQALGDSHRELLGVAEHGLAHDESLHGPHLSRCILWCSQAAAISGRTKEAYGGR